MDQDNTNDQYRSSRGKTYTQLPPYPPGLGPHTASWDTLANAWVPRAKANDPSKCLKHNNEQYQELWPGEWLCESCFVEAFRYQDEGLELE